MSKIYQASRRRRGEAVESFKRKLNRKRSIADRLADWLTSSFGTMAFLILNVIFFFVWLLINLDFIDQIAAFDPFPFELLTTIVSLEAIFLAIVVLISQNRAARIDELREEVELYINTYAESEITKLMYLQTLLLKKHGIDISHDPEIKNMLESLEPEKIEKELEKQLNGQ